MFKKIILFIFYFNLINPFNLKQTISSIIISSSLFNNNNLKLNEDYIKLNEDYIKIDNSKNYNSHPIIKINKNDIYFYGPITSDSCKELSDILLSFDKNYKIFSIIFGVKTPPINLHIQSEGGSILNSFYIIDLINKLDTPVYTYVDGYVDSAGSLISVVGKKRFMTKNSVIIIHKLSSSLDYGKYLDNNKFITNIRNIYLEKTKININNIFDHDLLMNSQECLELGLIDEIL
jgi:ATP-dependent protease ClpP protease subunit